MIPLTSPRPRRLFRLPDSGEFMCELASLVFRDRVVGLDSIAEALLLLGAEVKVVVVVIVGLCIVVTLDPETALALPIMPCTHASLPALAVALWETVRRFAPMGPAAPRGVYFALFAGGDETVVVVVIPGACIVLVPDGGAGSCKTPFCPWTTSSWTSSTFVSVGPFVLEIVDTVGVRIV